LFGLFAELDFHIHARGEIKLHQRVNRLRRGVNNVEKTLVGAHFELFAAFFIDVRRTIHGKFFKARRQRDRTPDGSTSALGRVSDFARGQIEDTVVKSLEANSVIMRIHGN